VLWFHVHLPDFHGSLHLRRVFHARAALALRTFHAITVTNESNIQWTPILSFVFRMSWHDIPLWILTTLVDRSNSYHHTYQVWQGRSLEELHNSETILHNATWKTVPIYNKLSTASVTTPFCFPFCHEWQNIQDCPMLRTSLPHRLRPNKRTDPHNYLSLLILLFQIITNPIL
jgi:hypothetical protein